MFEVHFNPIYPAEHRIKYCPSECTGEVAPQASPDEPVDVAPMELHAFLSPLRLYIRREILPLQVCISALDSLL